MTLRAPTIAFAVLSLGWFFNIEILPLEDSAGKLPIVETKKIGPYDSLVECQKYRHDNSMLMNLPVVKKWQGAPVII